MTLTAILSQHPIRLAKLGGNERVAFREAGSAKEVTHVLLHGIGSASGSWVFQLQAAQMRSDVRVLAWDAPGYGQSTPLPSSHPDASEYALRIWDWLDVLGVRDPVTLVGHSLGAIMAARATCLHPTRVRHLALLSPARGYGSANAVERDKKLRDRLTLLKTLGPQGMALTRSAAMLSPRASSGLVDAVRETMASIDPAGYTQASWLLARSDLLADLAAVGCPVTVASGSADFVTPPQACQDVARQVGQDWQDLGPIGHACPLEAPHAVNAVTGLAPQPSKEGAS